MASKKRKVVMGIAIVFLIGGIGILIFPYLAQKVYEINAEKVIQDYEDSMEEKRIKAEEEGDRNYFDELYALMQEYNRNLYETGQSELKDPFSYEQPSFDLTRFGFDENIIGYIEIPQMNIKLPIYLGASNENMRKGAVHLSQTSLSIGGNNTNSVIAAHRGMSTAAMFRNIEKLQVGDGITITNFRETLVYRVDEIKIIEPTDVEAILIQDDRDLVTLITCHPYRHNYQRYVVYCERMTETNN